MSFFIHFTSCMAASVANPVKRRTQHGDKGAEHRRHKQNAQLDGQQSEQDTGGKGSQSVAECDERVRRCRPQCAGQQGNHGSAANQRQAECRTE